MKKVLKTSFEKNLKTSIEKNLKTGYLFSDMYPRIPEKEERRAAICGDPGEYTQLTEENQKKAGL